LDCATPSPLIPEIKEATSIAKNLVIILLFKVENAFFDN